MKQLTINFCYASLLILVAFLYGCKENDMYQPPVEIPADKYLEFSTTKTCQVSLDYGFSNYPVIFAIYGEDPYTAEGDKKEIEPLFRASTDEKGKFTGEIVIPATTEDVWLSSDYIGPLLVKKNVAESGINFSQPEFIKSLKATKSRAATPNGQFSYPDGFRTLGDWVDVYGEPAYLLPETATLPAPFLYTVNKVYSYASTELDKVFAENHTVADILTIKEKTEIKLAFLKGTSNFKNTVGYFVFPTGTTPTLDNIEKVIAIPHSSYIYSGGARRGALELGSQVQLKYWDGVKFLDEFPAGVSIGWFLIPNKFNNTTGNIGTPAASEIRYSIADFNSGTKKQRTVSLYDEESGLIALGFEDNIDFNYSDAVFSIDVVNKNAIDGVIEMPEVPGGPTTDDNYTLYTGSLAFEDLWPSEGDYDMNDVVVYYKSYVYKNLLTNKVLKIVDEFTPKNNGAQLQNAFGYQFHKIGPETIKDVVLSDNIVSSFMKGQSLEPGQDHPTVILFDNIRGVVNQTFTVTTTFKGEMVSYSEVLPPYNPFIVAGSDEGRGKEIHLVNYPPTSLCDQSLFGSGDDHSRPDENLYYVSKNNEYPFAIHISNYDFSWPKPNVRINVAYQKFQNWAVNGCGSVSANWYKSPNQDLVDSPSAQ